MIFLELKDIEINFCKIARPLGTWCLLGQDRKNLGKKWKNNLNHIERIFSPLSQGLTTDEKVGQIGWKCRKQAHPRWGRCGRTSVA